MRLNPGRTNSSNKNQNLFKSYTPTPAQIGTLLTAPYKYSTVIPLFIKCLSKGKSPEIHWDGQQSRDFTYIENVVLGNRLAMRAEKMSGEVFNIAYHNEYSILDVFTSRILKSQRNPSL